MKKPKDSRDLLPFAILTVVCCGAKLFGVSPFGAPMFSALSGAPHSHNGKRGAAVSAAVLAFVAALFVACEYLFSFELYRVYASGAVAVIMLLRWFISLKVPKLNKNYVKIIFAVVALVAEAALTGVFKSAAYAVMDFVVALPFYYFGARAVNAVAARFAFRLGPQDGAACCAVLVVAGLAFGRASVYFINAGLALAALCIMLLCVMGAKYALCGGLSLGVGLALSLDLGTGLAVAASVLVVTAFLSMPRAVYAIVGVGAFAAFSVLFSVPPETVGWNSLMFAAGMLPVICLTKRAVARLHEYFDFDGGAKLAVRHYINKVKSDAGDRMLRLAAVFDETARLMNAFGDEEPDYNAVGAALSDRVCPYCPKQGICDRAAADPAFAEVAKTALTGAPIIAGLPEFFSIKCARVPEVTRTASEFCERAKRAAESDECDRKAKETVTERLTAVCDVLTELGTGQAQPVGFDAQAEHNICSELLQYGVECADAFVTRDGVTAIVRSGSADREKIRCAVSACMKTPFVVTELEHTRASGWSVAMLKKRPAYEAVYARAGVAKSGGVSGDSYTFKRISGKGSKGEKFLAALCDGMGTGKSAGADSGAAVELIECFYKAGFDSQSVLNGVNRFLKLPDSERYSAADIAVCDLATAQVDIIKIGAPACYIKTQDTVLKIEGSSLPIGVLDEMRPFVTSKRLYPGQMYISVSDGVSDCFDGDELASFINTLAPQNPDRVTNAILNRALELSGGSPRDDMTAIAFRLFDKPKRIKNAELRIQN